MGNTRPGDRLPASSLHRGPSASDPVDEHQLARGDAPGSLPLDRSVETARVSDADGAPVDPAVGGVGRSASDPVRMIAAGSLGIGVHRWIFLVSCARLPWCYVLHAITLHKFLCCIFCCIFVTLFLFSIMKIRISSTINHMINNSFTPLISRI